METIIGILIVTVFVGLTSYSMARTHELKEQSFIMLTMENTCTNIIQIIKSDSYFYNKIPYYLNNSVESEAIIHNQLTDTNQEFELYYDMYGNLCNTGEYAYIIYISCTINAGTFKTDITYQINKKLRLYSNEVTSAGESYRIKKVESA